MSVLSHWLYSISIMLLVPVMVLLLALLGLGLILLGGFLREWAGRRKMRRGLTAAIRELGEPGREATWNRLKQLRTGLPLQLVQAMDGSLPGEIAVLEHALGQIEGVAASRIALLSFLTRVGPMLGLMGTLIPLGPALTGLAAGNMQELSANLVIAFTTTIVGLFVSGLAFTMGLARRLWYDNDLVDLEFLVGRLKP
ncbi:MAG: MotA/TolQ/ExbB proton channel family protein [Planctomycetes bacterium]|nr:MotA/TolQ/ExbB proton channel family protein [Planctomycetota bacterium]